MNKDLNKQIWDERDKVRDLINDADELLTKIIQKIIYEGAKQMDMKPVEKFMTNNELEYGKPFYVKSTLCITNIDEYMLITDEDNNIHTIKNKILLNDNQELFSIINNQKQYIIFDK